MYHASDAFCGTMETCLVCVDDVVRYPSYTYSTREPEHVVLHCRNSRGCAAVPTNWRRGRGGGVWIGETFHSRRETTKDSADIDTTADPPESLLEIMLLIALSA